MPSTSCPRPIRLEPVVSRLRAHGEQGSTLLDALIGLSLIAVLLVSMASLLAMARQVTLNGRRQLQALALARARLEQLQSLDFAREPLAGGGVAEITDLTTDLSGREPEIGGRGLADSPADSLVRPAEGYADYLDAYGQWMGRDADAGAGASYVRRWRVERAGVDAGEIAIVDVLVAPATIAARLTASAAPIDVWLSHPDVVRLSGLRARRAR